MLPAIWTFFYSSRHGKATCEARDTLTRWTDMCPLPVLALSLWSLFSGPTLLLMPIMGHGVMPFFGTFLTGLPGMLLGLAMAGYWGYAAWLIYRLKPLGWWLLLIAFCVFLVSGVVTFARYDPLEMYQLMGYPQAQIEQLRRTGLLAGNRMRWLMAFAAVPFLAYLLFVKRYFRGKS